MLLAKDSDKSYNYYENLDNSQQDEYNIVLKANKGDKLASFRHSGKQRRQPQTAAGCAEQS